MTTYHQILQCVFPYNALVIDPVDNFFSSIILVCTSCCFTIQTHRFFHFFASHISLLSLMFKFFLVLLMPAPLSWFLCSLSLCLSFFECSLILRLNKIFRFILDFPTPALKWAMGHFFKKYCFPFSGEEFSETKIWKLGVFIPPRVSLLLVPLTRSFLKLFWAFIVPEYFSWI